MAIETSCSGCGKRLAVGDEFGGRRARCPSCGQIYTVPLPPSNAFDEQLSTPGVAEVKPVSGFDETTAPVSEDAGRFWIRTESGQEFGPVDRDNLNRWFVEGRVGENYEVRQGNAGPWQPSALFAPRGDGQPSYGPTSAVAGSPISSSFPANPYQSSGVGSTQTYSQSDKSGVVLAMGILSFFICPIFGVVAWVMGANALKAIEAGEADPANKGMVQAGYYLGMISVLLHIACVGISVLIVAISSVAGAV